MKTACFENSILEIFAQNGKYNELTEKILKEITQQDIINAINTVTERYYYNYCCILISKLAQILIIKIFHQWSFQNETKFRGFSWWY